MVWLGKVRLGWVKRGLVWLSLVRLGWVRLGKVRIGWVRLGLIRIGKVRLGWVRLGKFRLGWVVTASLIESHRNILGGNHNGRIFWDTLRLVSKLQSGVLNQGPHNSKEIDNTIS